ncbi:DEAD/DEAH box helicase [Xanthomonas campestris pv. trichodesmae]|uniref:DNA helicase n=2 Tax=Xanthomonas citri TaxID=346 RepID=A0AB33CMQ6_XANCI|nr:DEAD/DEAH box helicase [Xanthomonas citri]ASK94715.1 DNA helicase [Xanthomonas citri pv. vignicola]MBV6782542.1 DEAD/DEAH box helicase [Xanthomonas campestris pv. trichodesmae]MBZ3918518.1 hypothetical protein [Xanthomonas campestris pv. trichodesmae]MBZ3925589.1 hypothetical protein [Xanthomonas citri pv. sesbaniae]
MGALAKIRKQSRPVIAGIRSDGFRVGLSTGFHPDIVATLKEKGASWSASSRTWVLPADDRIAPLLDELGHKGGTRMSYDRAIAHAQLVAALETPEVDAFAPDLDVKIYPVAGDGGYVVDTRYDILVVACLRALGGRLLSSKEGWYIQRSLEQLLADLAFKAGVLRGHVFIHEGEIRIDRTGGGYEAEERPTINVSGAEVKREQRGEEEGEEGRLAIVLQPLQRHDVDMEWFEKATASMSLLDHQPAGILHLLGANSALLGDEPGLGKSRQSAAALHLMPGTGCRLLIAPASLCINWSREILAVDPRAKVSILDKEGVAEEPEWLIASYEKLGVIVQAITDGVIAPRAVVFDEAHSIIQPTASRTLNAFLVAQKVPRRYLLTATPILNRIVELHTLLRLSGHPLGDMDRGEFAKEFAGSQEARVLLAQRVSEWMLRRPKSVLGLDAKVQDPRYLELSGPQGVEYRRMAADPSLTALAKIGRLRQYLERQKADWLIQTVAAMDVSDKALIMCEFQDTVDYLAEEFAKAGIEVVTFLGKHSKTRKQQAIDRFQSEPGVRCFIGTTKAAGVGHTLTAANVVCFASLPWTNALKKQAEDRAWRYGQKRIVTVLIPLFAGTIDEQAMALIQHKAAIENDLLEDPAAAILNLGTASNDPEDASEISVADPEYAAILQYAKVA